MTWRISTISCDELIDGLREIKEKNNKRGKEHLIPYNVM